MYLGCDGVLIFLLQQKCLVVVDIGNLACTYES
jgi:hypothetical protein